MAIEKIIDIQVNSNFDATEAQLKELTTALKNVDKEATNLDATFEEIYGDLKPLTTQMGEMEDRLYQLSLTGNTATKEYKDLLQAVGRYKQVQQETDKVVDAASMTMGSKLSGSLGAAAGGFSLVQGSMSLFGAESSSVEESMLKVQEAMAISQGFETIREGTKSVSALATTVKSYSIVQKAITAGQWLWNAAMTANPIGAIILAITALIAAGYALTKYFMDNAEASEKNAKALKNDTKALNEQIKTADKNSEAIDINSKQKLAMAKASGKSAEEIRKLELKLADEKIAFERSSREIAKNTYYKNENTLATLKAAGASDEEIKSREEVLKASLKAFEKENKDLTAAVKEKAAIINRHQVEVRTDETKHNSDLRSKAKEAAEKAAEDKKAQQKKDAEDLKSALEAQKNAELTNRDEVSKAIEEAQEKQSIANLTASEAEQRVVKDKYFGLIELAKQQNRSKEEIDILEAQRLDELNKIKDKFRLEDDAKKATELEKTINDNQLSFENRLAAVDAEQALYQKQFDDKLISEKDFNEKSKGLTESRIKITETEAQAKQKALAAISSGLKTAATLLGESTAAGKAAAIAATTIDTIQSGVSAFKGMVAAVPGPVGIGLGVVAAAGALASGYASVKKILSVKTPGGAGGGAGVPSGGAPTAPSFNVVGASGTNQLAQSIGAQKQEPLKAYVTAGDVTTGQSLNRNIIQNASMG